jgi:Protein of unknown function (DUF3300)
MSGIQTFLSRASPRGHTGARGNGAMGAALMACAMSCALLSAQTYAQGYPPAPPSPGYTQDYAPPPPPAPAGYPTDYSAPAPAAGAVSTANYSPEQLDQLLAPIALYPDDLLGQVLMASTYPLEVVQADRWLQSPANASLRGSSLAQALQELPWDSSVKSLVAYPRILAWMDNDLDWTEAAGDAFLAQQAAVMDSVQRLRARAQTAGTLNSTPQQTVTSDGQDIAITSPDNTVEYVPVYNPDVAYGPWPYPDYPPYGFSDPDYAFGTYIAFPILVPYWGWDRCDWHHHRIDIDNGWHNGWHGRPAPTAGQPPQGRFATWHHDPAHRGGVPYRDPATRARYEGKTDIHSIRSNYRGYPVTAQPAARAPVVATRPAGQYPAPVPQAQRTPAPMPRTEAPRPEAQRLEPRAEYRPPAAARPEQPRPMPRPEAPRPAPPRPAPVAVERPMPPAMESFGRGAEVHVQEQRGFASRSEPAGQAPAHGGGGHR